MNGARTASARAAAAATARLTTGAELQLHLLGRHRPRLFVERRREIRRNAHVVKGARRNVDESCLFAAGDVWEGGW
jgi:hypothetical protein